MAIYHEDIVNIELESGNIFRSFAKHTIGLSDSAANRFGVRVFRGGEPADLTGVSCQGFFRDPQGNNIALTGSGSVAGNKAYVTLPQACYNYEGQFCLAIKLVGGGVTGTMRIVDGMVDNTFTDGAVVPTESVPDYEEILAVYDQMVEALNRDQTEILREAVITAEPGKRSLAKLSAWTLNSIDTTTGENDDDGKHMRTENYIPLSYPQAAIWWKIANGNGLDLAVRTYMYDENLDYIGSNYTLYHGGHDDPDDTTEGIIHLPDETVKYVRFMVYARTTDTFTSVEDVLQFLDIEQRACASEFGTDPFFSQLKIIPGAKMDISNEGITYFVADKTRACSLPVAVGKGTVIAYNCPYFASDTTYYDEPLWIECFDRDLKRIEAYSGDYTNLWTAPEDCYIRMQFRYTKSSSTTFTDAAVAEVLGRISVFYLPPTAPGIVPVPVDEVSGFAGTMTYQNGLTLTVTDPHLYEKASTGRVTTDYFPVGKGTTLFTTEYGTDSTTTAASKLYFHYYDKNFIRLGDSYDYGIMWTAPQDCYVRVALRRKSSATASMSAADLAVIESYLKCCYTAPTDPDFLEPEALREKHGIDRGAEVLHRAKIDSAVTGVISAAEANQMSYAWVSDVHISATPERQYFTRFIAKRTARAIVKAAEEANLDFICIGGDVVDAEAQKANAYDMVKQFRAAFDDCTVPVIWLIGNHDNNTYGGSNHAQELSQGATSALFAQNSRFHNDIVMGDATEGFFWFDIPAKQRRVVCFNGNAPEGDEHTSGWWSIDKKQVKWFCEKALDTNYAVTILSHTIPGTTYEFYGTGDEEGYHTAVAGAIAAYNARSTYTYDGTTYDYTAATGRVTHWHCGHLHFDLDPEYEDATWGGVPIIETSCAKAWNATSGAYTHYTPVQGTDDLYTITQADQSQVGSNTYGYKFFYYNDRAFGYPQECLFDVVSVGAGKVKTFRIGAGHDREYDI